MADARTGATLIWTWNAAAAQTVAPKGARTAWTASTVDLSSSESDEGKWWDDYDNDSRNGAAEGGVGGVGGDGGGGVYAEVINAHYVLTCV